MLLTRDNLPDTIADIGALDELLCRPSQALIDDLEKRQWRHHHPWRRRQDGPDAPRAKGRPARRPPDHRRRAIQRRQREDVAGGPRHRGASIATCSDEAATKALPKIKNIIFMAGRKFGAEGDLSLTWAMNAHVPRVGGAGASGARIVAFSTACVYPFARSTAGRRRDGAPNPPGRIRQFLRCARAHVRVFLAPACNARPPAAALLCHRHALWRAARRGAKILARQPIDLTMGHANIIWQGEANDWALRCLAHCATPDQFQRPEPERTDP